MLHCSQGNLLSLTVCPEQKTGVRKKKRNARLAFVSKEGNRYSNSTMSVFSSHNRSQCPVSWEKYMRKGNSSHREISDPWEFMPKALTVFEETV